MDRAAPPIRTTLAAQNGMMPDPHDNDDLRRSKSLNVGQQVAVAQTDIRRTATIWRNNQITPAIRAALTQNGFDVDAGIFIDLCDREAGLEDYADGTFVTASERFIEFSIQITEDGERLTSINFIRDVTDTLDICGRKPGIGATRPFLAIEVLRELNAEAGG